jgi:hypothetical protein
MAKFEMLTLRRCLLLLLSCTLYGLHTQALAEIILPSGASNNSSNRSKESASEARQRAKEAVSDSNSISLEALQNLIGANEEEGFMLPGRSSAPPDNRARAKEYIQNESDANKLIIITQPGAESSGDANSSKENASRNANKAKRYLQDQPEEATSTGKNFQFGASTGVMGKDGVIVMPCDGVNNNVGLIGDDSKSGNLFSVIVNGRSVPARCK